MDQSLNPEDYEDIDIDDPDNPELKDEDFTRARPFKEVFPDLHEQLVREGIGASSGVKKAS